LQISPEVHNLLYLLDQYATDRYGLSPHSGVYVDA